jgi:ribonuclease T2
MHNIQSIETIDSIDHVYLYGNRQIRTDSSRAGPYTRRMNKTCLRQVLTLVILALFGSVSAAGHRHHRHANTAAKSVAGTFDYFILTLSWSPTYCLTHRDDQAQCGKKGFGFVLHGLWPQYVDGGYPENCAASRNVPTAAYDFAKTIFPSPKLIDHEWSHHGTCSGLDPMAYFKTADKAFSAFQVPRELAAPARNLSTAASGIEALIRHANPAIPPDGLAVSCSRTEFADVRICLGRDLRPISCGEGVRTRCPRGDISVPASR